jgi:outer membrane receptor protein involved in Fe transport
MSLRPASARASELRPPIGDGAELRIGGEWRETEGETKELFNFQNGVGTRRRLAGGRTRTLGAFAEVARETGRWTLTGGGRIDRWRIHDGFLRESVIATGASLNDLSFSDRSGWEPTARAGIAFRPAGAITLRTAAYLGWRLPTLNELYRPFRVGADATAANAALAPERLRGVEAGIEYRPLNKARIGITLFANRLDDGIANVTLGRGPGVFPGVGFVAAGGEFRQRRNLDAIEVTASRWTGSWRTAPGRCRAATASPMPRSGQADPRSPSPASALPRRRATALPEPWPGAASTAAGFR